MMQGAPYYQPLAEDMMTIPAKQVIMFNNIQLSPIQNGIIMAALEAYEEEVLEEVGNIEERKKTIREMYNIRGFFVE
jgi:hypothetical protein